MVAEVCRQRVAERLMLHEDADRYVLAAKAKNPFDSSLEAGTVDPERLQGCAMIRLGLEGRR